MTCVVYKQLYKKKQKKTAITSTPSASLIFEELYMDKIGMIHLLTKYYMVINQKNKVFIDNLKKNIT